VIRINLIPPEILQNRKDERRWKWMALAGGIIAAVLVMFWAFMALQVTASVAEVDSIVAEATALESQAAQFQVFKQTEADLGVRKSAVVAAKAGEVDWARMLYELGLVLPKDIYLTSFTGSDAGAGGKSTISIAGQALDKIEDAPDNGYKSVAKMLVRLADLSQARFSVALEHECPCTGQRRDDRADDQLDCEREHLRRRDGFSVRVGELVRTTGSGPPDEDDLLAEDDRRRGADRGSGRRGGRFRDPAAVRAARRPATAEDRR